MSNEQPLLSEMRDGVCCLTLNRPDRLNAINDVMGAQLISAFENCANPETRAVLLTGTGRGFCAGQDLNARNPTNLQAPPDLGATLETIYNPLIRLIRHLPKPVICAVNGVAAGAGANLALACDIVLAAQSARFIQAFAAIGLIPDSGGTWLLPRLIGEAHAKALMLTGTPLNAAQAVECGLIWKAVPDEQLADEANALAKRLASGPTIGLGLTKLAVQKASEQGLDAHLDFERDTQRKAGQSEDYAEGVSAFLAKRAAIFRGK